MFSKRALFLTAGMLLFLVGEDDLLATTTYFVNASSDAATTSGGTSTDAFTGDLRFVLIRSKLSKAWVWQVLGWLILKQMASHRSY